jgi:hypothetical protein
MALTLVEMPRCTRRANAWLSCGGVDAHFGDEWETRSDTVMGGLR